MSRNHHHNSRLGLPDYNTETNNFSIYASENHHYPYLNIPQNHHNHPYLNIPENHHDPHFNLPQNHHGRPYFNIPENHHDPYSIIPENNPQNYTPEADHLNSLYNKLQQLNIGHSSVSHASSSYVPSFQHPGNGLPDGITTPGRSDFVHESIPRRNTSYNNYVDNFLASNEPTIRDYYPETIEKTEKFLYHQNRFNEGLSNEDLFSEIVENIDDLMVDDQCGHGLIIDFLNKCNAKQISAIIERLVFQRDLMKEMCLHVKGGIVIQNLFEQLRMREQINEIRLVCAVLKPDTMMLATDTHGYYVIKKWLEVFDFEDNWLIAEEIALNARELVVDQRGVFVLGVCIKNAPKMTREPIVRTIVSRAVYYSAHPYGNFAVQAVLETGDPCAITRIFMQLKGSFVSMSMNKCASNVVEKCLKFGTQGEAITIITELTNDPRFRNLIRDEYGNYVAQTALKRAQGSQLSYLRNRIMEHRSSLEFSQYGKKLLKATRSR